LHLSLHHEQTSLPQLPKNILKSWLSFVIQKFEKEGGDISLIFCSDAYLLKVNQKYLNKDYLTDIITFDYSSGQLIAGDLFISAERVKDNAFSFNVPFESELLRVIVHGVLHLLGYRDQTPDEKNEMRKQEDKYLRIYHVIKERNEQ
jgi:rRNA maturation RNase YbeY